MLKPILLSATLIVAAVSPVEAQSPQNLCGNPNIAGLIISDLNDFPAIKNSTNKVVDLEGVTTIRTGGGMVSCHVVAVMANFLKQSGTFWWHKNVAGDLVYAWAPDL